MVFIGGMTNTETDTLEVTDEYGRQILTVGALKAFIADLPDYVHVVIDDNDSWYLNVSHVHKPIEVDGEFGAGDWAALTLAAGDEFDPRQF
jgi:hypothetical protein